MPLRVLACLEATLRRAVRAYRYMVKSQFDLSNRRGVIRRPNSRASPGVTPVSTLDQKPSGTQKSSPVRASRRALPTVVQIGCTLTFCRPLSPRPTCRPFQTAFEQLVPVYKA